MKAPASASSEKMAGLDRASGGRMRMGGDSTDPAPRAQGERRPGDSRHSAQVTEIVSSTRAARLRPVRGSSRKTRLPKGLQRPGRDRIIWRSRCVCVR